MIKSFFLPVVKKKVRLKKPQICIQKEDISDQKQPSCKKRVRPQKGYGEKDVKSKVAAELSLLNFLPLTYHHSHCLAATLDFTSFFTMAI